MKKLAGLTAALVAAVAVFGGATPAHAVTPAGTRAANAAASWLGRQLQYGGGYGPNDGSSIDAALQLAATGHGAVAGRIADAVEADDAGAYTDSAYCATSPYTCQAGDPGWLTSRGAGEVAKALVLAEVMNASDVPDLVGELEPLVQSNGEVADDVTLGGVAQPADNSDNYANVLGQAYAVWGLDVYDPTSTAATSATTYLLSQQCSNGAFPTSFIASGTATPFTCSTKVGSVDTTATVLLALENLQPASGVTSAKKKALAFLTSSQTKSGGFSQTGVAKGVDANSTGLAGWALGAAGRKAAAAKAAGWLVAHQVPAKATGKLEAVRGAIEYDAATLAAARKKGWKAAQDQWIVATSQCVAALTYAPKAR